MTNTKPSPEEDPLYPLGIRGRFCHETVEAMDYEPQVGDKVTNGTITATVTCVDNTGVLLSNGYCPNRNEFRIDWTKAST